MESWIASHLGSACGLSSRETVWSQPLQGTKEINSGVSQQPSDAAALETIFTAREANCIFQLIKLRTKRLAAAPQIPQVPPRRRRLRFVRAAYRLFIQAL